MVGSYAVGDVRALVPARKKAVWSLPGEPKASGKTFFLLSVYTVSLRYFCPI